MLRPSRNDIRVNAVRFAHEWQADARERGEAQTFWTEFLRIFGVERRRVNAAFERHARRATTGRSGFIDLLWPGMLLAEHKSRGANLSRAMDQALDYIDGLDAKELPRLVVVSDFAHVRVHDLDEPARGSFEFPLGDLPGQIGRFHSLAGYITRRAEPEDAVNVKAAELLGRVYDELAATGYRPDALRAFIVRVLFLLFGDDTGLWTRNQVSDLVRARTSEDGADLGMWLGRLCTVVDTPEDRRTSALDEDLAAFPYVNGGLFAERFEPPDTGRSTRDRLLEASTFDWSKISPAVFGSMFQSVMDPVTRRSLGAHYTSEANILKVIGPLFLDELRAELDGCGRSASKLRAFHERLGSLKFFDPACGCGNFLVIAYREVRRLETEALRRLNPAEVQMTIDLSGWRRVSLEQFHGIELEEFPARIAQTAMYLVDHLENEAMAALFGGNVADLPLARTAKIHVGNALRMDWEAVLPAAECSYLLGNPPYVGKHLMDAAQRDDLASVSGDHRFQGSLDYVSGWFIKAADYLTRGKARGAFVTTNSITQGEQVPALWPLLHERGLHISFAWRTFNWKSEGRGAAHVHVVIVGFEHAATAPGATLFEADTSAGTSVSRRVSALNGYLVEGAEVYPSARATPLDPTMPPVIYGAKPADGGHLLLSPAEAEAIRATDPVAARYIRPLYSATEFLNGGQRFCLWLEGADPTDLRGSTVLLTRLADVRRFRAQSKKPQTRARASTPSLFAEVRRPTTGFVFVPRHSSAVRRLIPMGFVGAGEEAIVHDSGAYIPGADLALFGILQSEMFATWQRAVGGRIKSDYRFNNRVVYNTFVLPALSTSRREALTIAASGVLEARASFPEASLADLYHPLGGPAALVGAHKRLDAAVDAVYGRRSSPSESERLALLFANYTAKLGS